MMKKKKEWISVDVLVGEQQIFQKTKKWHTSLIQMEVPTNVEGWISFGCYVGCCFLIVLMVVYLLVESQKLQVWNKVENHYYLQHIYW